MSITVRLALALSALSLMAFGCNEPKPTPAPKVQPAPIKTVTIPEVAQLVKTHAAVIVDANGAKTRNDMGVIPGALLLTDHEKFALTELPPAKAQKLVFYCGNLQCGASHVAARRAIDAGYSDVSVLPDGIAGWREAGEPVAVPRS
jgi:rhodanese-related sulfurtransferase